MGVVLITGAAGFIGSQLAYRMKKNGETVVLVDDFSYGSKDNLIFSDDNLLATLNCLNICDIRHRKYSDI